MIIDVLDQIKTTLQANLPGKLAQVATARGLSLPNVAKYFILPQKADYFDNAPITDFPCIFIVAERSPESHLATAHKDISHSILIAPCIRETSFAHPETAYRKLYAYIEAIEKTLNTDHTLGGTVIKSEIIISNYTESIRTGDVLVLGATMELTVLERITIGG